MEFARIKSRFRDEIHQTPKQVKQLNLQKLKSSVGMKFTKSKDQSWDGIHTAHPFPLFFYEIIFLWSIELYDKGSL